MRNCGLLNNGDTSRGAGKQEKNIPRRRWRLWLALQGCFTQAEGGMIRVCGKSNGLLGAFGGGFEGDRGLCVDNGAQAVIESAAPHPC